MAITHTFVSPVTEGTGSGSTFVGPTEWNNSHTIAAGTVTRAMAATDLVGWQFLGAQAPLGSSNTTLGPVTLSTAKDHLQIRLVIAGYGTTAIARLQLGNTTTIDTSGAYAFTMIGISGATATASSAPTVSGISSAATGITGIPVGPANTTAGRLVHIEISNPGAHSKFVTIHQSGDSTGSAAAPAISFVSGIWANTTNGIGVVQFQAYSGLTGTGAGTLTFNAGSMFTVWGRNNGE